MRPRTLSVAALLIGLGTLAAFAALPAFSALSLRPTWYLTAFSLAAALTVAAVWRKRDWLTVGALVVSMVLLVAGGFFNFVMMRVPAGRPLVTIGQPAPGFTLPDAAGRPVSLSDYRGRKPVVLVFYRGYW